MKFRTSSPCSIGIVHIVLKSLECKVAEATPPSLEWPDYIVVGAVLTLSASIGIYYRFSGGRQKTAAVLKKKRYSDLSPKSLVFYQIRKFQYHLDFNLRHFLYWFSLGLFIVDYIAKNFRIVEHHCDNYLKNDYVLRDHYAGILLGE